MPQLTKCKSDGDIINYESDDSAIPIATKKVKSTLPLKKTSALLSKVQIIILAGSIIQIPMLFLNLP